MLRSRVYSAKFSSIEALFITAINDGGEYYNSILWWLNQRTPVEKYLLKKYAGQGKMCSAFPSIEKRLRTLMQSLFDFLRSTGQWY